MRATSFTLIALCALGLLVGCLHGQDECVGCLHGQDECEVGTGHCNGDVAVVCEPPCAEIGCGSSFVEQPCGRVCVEDYGTAFCALSVQKDARCEPDTRSFCDGSRLISCYRDYAVSSGDCAEMERECGETEGHAVCALSSEPDERCGEGSPDASASTCDGRHRLTCTNSFLVFDKICDLACAQHEGGADCSLMEGPDPLCAQGAETQDGDSHCAGDRIYRCAYGVSVFEADCAAGEGICVEDAIFTRCEFPLPPEEVAEARGVDPGVNEPPREVSSPDPDPRCPPAEPFASVCDGQKWLSCEDGRATYERQCAHACVALTDDSGSGAWCTLADGSDERCAPDQIQATRGTWRCAGDVTFFCSDGRALEELDCRETGDICVPAREGHSAYCAAPDAP